MTEIIHEEEYFDILKKRTNYQVKCPVCNENQTIGIENRHYMETKNFPLTHIHIHGSPVHALVIYVDKQLNVRAVESSESIEIKQDGRTFSEVIKKWAFCLINS